MKRTIFAIISLISAVVFCFTGYLIINNTCNTLKESLTELSTIAQEGNITSAQEKSKETVELWEEIHGKIEAFTPHMETDVLEETVKSLPTYARQGNMERLEQETEKAINRLEHIVKNEKPIVSNIF